MATYAPNQLHSVPLAELQPDPTQPRKYLDPLALEELTAYSDASRNIQIIGLILVNHKTG